LFDCTGSGTLLGTSVIGTPVGTSQSQTITPVGNGWYRCTLTVTVATTGNTGYNVSIQMIETGTNTSYTGVTGNGLYVWGMQLELGSFATSYIPTATTAVERKPDTASMTNTNFTSWYNPTQGTFVAEFDRFGFDSVAGSVAVVQADDNSSANRVALRVTPRTSTAGAQGTIVSGNTVLANDSQTSTNLANVVRKSAFAYQVGVGAITSDGQAPTAITSVASLPTVTQLGIGIPLGGGAVAINGHIRRIQYFPARLTNAQLQTLTT
jgi:hypothetical protein